MADSISRRLNDRELLARTVTTKLRYGDFTTRTRSTTLATGTDEADRIYKLACELLDGRSTNGRVRSGSSASACRGSAPRRSSRSSSVRVRETRSRDRHTPWWLEEAPPDEAAPALARDVEADVAIVGGGYCGLWTARALKERCAGPPRRARRGRALRPRPERPQRGLRPRLLEHARLGSATSSATHVRSSSPAPATGSSPRCAHSARTSGCARRGCSRSRRRPVRNR